MKKRGFLSKLTALAMVGAMISAVLPGVCGLAEEEGGILWDSMDTAEHWWMAADDKQSITLSVNENPEFVREGTGSLAVRRVATGQALIRCDDEFFFPKAEGKVIRSLSVWVYSDDAQGDLGILGRVGTESINTDNTEAKKTIVPGWQHWVFDVTQFDKMDLFVWNSSTSAEGTLYFDDMRITYSDPAQPLDSFEQDYAENWNTPTSVYAVSENTDKQYIKDGNISLKVDCTAVNGESYVLLSKYAAMKQLEGARIPEFPGYAKRVFGYWVYNVDAQGVFVVGERKLKMTEPGWHYFKFDAQDRIGVPSVIFQCDQPGTFYLDALTVEYDDLSATVLDRLESSSGWNGTKPEYLQIVDPDGIYAKEGLTSAKVTLPAGLGETGLHRSDWKNNGLAIPQKADQKLSQVGLWVYGCGDPAVKIKLGLRDLAGEDVDTASVPIDWEGWKFITFDASPSIGYVYQFIVENKSDAEQIIYIDAVEAIYVPDDGVIDSMDTVAETWFFPSGSKMTAEQNTDPAFVQEGNGSVKITRTGAGEYGLVSKNHAAGGMNFPEKPGKTPDVIGVWIYNVDADGTVIFHLKKGDAEVQQPVPMPAPGEWTYVSADVDGADSLYQFIFKSEAEGGTFYMDALTLNYLDNERYVFDSMTLKNGDNPLVVGDLQDQDVITLEAAVSKTDNTERKFSLLLAVYSPEGKLMGVQEEKITIAADTNGEFVKTAAYTVEDASAVGSVKGFAMDSLNTLLPLCESVEN